jgi:hypothetical protein
MATVSMLGNPLSAVRRAEKNAGLEEAHFQLARLEAVVLSRETAENRALAQHWLKTLQQYIDNKGAV